MEISGKYLRNLLCDYDVDTIYHANSVIASCQFLSSNSLLSRWVVERDYLLQTKQYTNAADRHYDFWFDVFIDLVDIHDSMNNANAYGPVLFAIDADVIVNSGSSKVWVTKLNPIKWIGRQHKEKWFTSSKDLKEGFVTNNFDNTIVFRNCSGVLPLQDYLKQIIVDDPMMVTADGDVEYYSIAYGALSMAMTQGGINVDIRKRQCTKQCSCIGEYQNDTNRTDQLFFPAGVNR